MASLDSTSDQTYAGTPQTAINRMVVNSAACKRWSIALVSTIIIIVVFVDKPDFIWISLFPVFLFSVLDSFYLGLKQRVQTLHNTFIHKPDSNTAKTEDLSVISQRAGVVETFISTLSVCKSVSILPFYIEDLFIISRRVGVVETFISTLNAYKSVSIWLFYGVLVVILVSIGIWIL